MVDAIWYMRRSGVSAGRVGDSRLPEEHDRSRIIHSSAFRRLQAKTQVLGVNEGDFHRTRLTHSMEAAQISRGLVARLASTRVPIGAIPPQALLEAACLAHDIGHPPFGHAGETALNYVMRNDGGFEGNGQTLRILSKLESHTPEHGLDLTRRALLATVKYPVLYPEVAMTGGEYGRERNPTEALLSRKPPKCIMACDRGVLDWILADFDRSDRERFREFTAPAGDQHGHSKYHSLDASLVELADDIAYAVHDFEDAVALRLLDEDAANAVFRDVPDGFMSRLRSGRDPARTMFSGEHWRRKDVVGDLVNAFIGAIDVREVAEFSNPILRWNAVLPDSELVLLRRLKDAVLTGVVKTFNVQTIEFRGQYIVRSLFEAIASDPKRLLPDRDRRSWADAASSVEKMRVVCDYVAGMTDAYATRLYERMFIPRHGSSFERL